MSEPYNRTVARDIRILKEAGPEDSPKEIARRFNLNIHVVYRMFRRRKKFKYLYQMFHEEQLRKTSQNGNGDVER